MTTTSRRLIRTAALATLGAGAIGAQSVPVPAIRQITIAGNPSCTKCRIELVPIGTIGGPKSGDELGDGSGTFYALDSHSRVYVADNGPGGKGLIQVFDSSGRKLARIGRFGSGPGEYKEISGLQIGAGDTIHVFDDANARHSVLAPGTGKYLRGYPWMHGSWGIQYVRLSAGLLAVNEIKRVGGQWLAYNVVDSLDRQVRAFGPSVRRFNGSNAHQLSTLTAGSKPDRFLALHHWEYVIDEWNTTGTLLTTITRKANWFIPFLPDPDNFPKHPDDGPGYFMQSIWRDAAGLIWVTSRVPDPAWSDYTTTKTLPDGRTYRAPSDRNKYWDTRIEVIDPVAGTLIASERFDRFYTMSMGGGALISTMTEDAAGEPYWHLVRPRLVRP